MIKVIVHVAKVIAAVVTALLFFSCGMETVDGTGNVTTQTRDIAAKYTSITADKGLEVYLQEGAVRAITVKADENLQEHIIVEAKGTELKITSDVNIGTSASKIITITLPEIKSIEAGSSAVVKGSTTLKNKDIKLSASSDGKIEVAVIAEEVTCESSSSGSIKISGTADKLIAETSSGGSLTANNLHAKSVEADASSGGTALVNPKESLAADASSGGIIKYTNQAKDMDIQMSSGGNVSKQ